MLRKNHYFTAYDFLFLISNHFYSSSAHLCTKISGFWAWLKMIFNQEQKDKCWKIMIFSQHLKKIFGSKIFFKNMCRILSRKKACPDIKNVFCATLQPIKTLMEALLVFLLVFAKKKSYILQHSLMWKRKKALPRKLKNRE